MSPCSSMLIRDATPVTVLQLCLGLEETAVLRASTASTATALSSCIASTPAVYPFVMQLFNSIDPALADLDETPDHEGADLMASRHDAWEQLVIDKVKQALLPSYAHVASTALM